jgi:ankyrin repeat protein
MDKKDLRGKTPLELAVFLDHFECAKILVEHGADCGIITKAGWNCKTSFKYF